MSTRQTILSEIKTNLANISISNGYNIDIGTIYDYENLPEMEVNQDLYIYDVINKKSFTYEKELVEMSINIVFVCNSSENVRKFNEDIINWCGTYKTSTNYEFLKWESEEINFEEQENKVFITNNKILIEYLVDNFNI